MPSRISDAHPKEYLDLNSVQELPDSHAWASAEEYPSGDVYSGCCKPDESVRVPVINLNDPNVMKLVGQACKTWGVFQLINHGLESRVFEDVESAAGSLFSLPVDQKLKAARTSDGITGYGLAHISPFFSKLMWSECFTISGSPLQHARQLWPHHYNAFCDVVQKYDGEMEQLAGRLMWLMLGSLGITQEDVKWGDIKGAFKGVLQLNSYPACPDPGRAMGLAAHTDSTLLTILHQSNISGLQVFREGTGWITVPPTPGTLVVNVGDLLHILSNGLYPSVIHRAMVNRTQHRLSVAYLFGPPAGVQISPHSKLVDHTHPPLYRPVTWREYLDTKAKHFNKALSTVRVCAPQVNGLMDTNEHNGVKVG